MAVSPPLLLSPLFASTQLLTWVSFVLNRSHLIGKNALLSIQLIDCLSIYSSIAFLPASFATTLSPSSPARPHTALSTALILDQILLGTSSSTLPEIHPALLGEREKKERSRLFLAAFASPYKGLTVKPGKTAISAVETIVKEGLKVSSLSR